jgi:hypothetical protein
MQSHSIEDFHAAMALMLGPFMVLVVIIVCLTMMWFGTRGMGGRGRRRNKSISKKCAEN